MIRSVLLFSVILVTAAYSAVPVLPCKTPQELFGAVRYSLENQDTNLFWHLHCWTNVSERMQRTEKGLYAVYFKEAPTDELTFRSFKLVQPPPAWYTNTTKGENALSSKFNIRLKGLILFRQHETKTLESPALKKPMIISGNYDREVPFGMSDDGTFWIAVLLPSTRTNRPPTIPSSVLTNLHRMK